MRLHRFYIKQKIDQNQAIILSDTELIHQLVKVFRFKAGDSVIVFDGSGFEYEAEIITINKKEVQLKIEKTSRNEFVTDKSVSLFLSLIKKNNFELAVEKVTEIGVSEIYPIMSEHSEKKGLNLDRLNKIVKEASEQSGRVALPKVFDICDLKQAVSQAIEDKKFCIAFHTNKHDCQPPMKDDSDDFISGKEIAVFIGPEGGWTDSEIDLFERNNFSICSLGHNILRAETAAVVAVWEAFHRE